MSDVADREPAHLAADPAVPLGSSPASDAPAEPGQEVPRWEQRFRAGRIGLPEWAELAPQRTVVEATVGGVLEAHCWDAATGELTQATSRPEGTSHVTIDPAGEWVWWFDDTAGDEHGVWRRQPWGTGPQIPTEDPLGLLPAYSAGLALGRTGVVVVGRNDDEYGTRIEVLVPGGSPGLLYEHREDAWVADLSADDALVAIAHSEHGDSRHHALRVLRVEGAGTVAEKWDGPGKGLNPLAFAPARPDGSADPRLLVLHERRGRGELLVWDVLADTEQEVRLEVPGEVAAAEWTHDGRGLVVLVDHDARTLLHRVDVGTGAAEPIGPTEGSVWAATARPDGDVWLAWSSAAQPTAVRNLAGEVLLRPTGAVAPPSVPVEDVWVDGEGGRIHALLRRPEGAVGPLPLVVEAHGGPTHHDTDSFRAYAAAWVDAGCAVVQVNYRGSTGYGSAWRDALEQRVGHTELADIAAVADHLVATGVADPERLVLAGASWGGYLTLLGLGTQPERWALGLAGVPVADYVAAYEDEMEGLKSFDRSLFGGSPADVPEKYRDSSPLTYVGAVRAPVLVLAGENDPRCPIRQIENYLEALRARGAAHEVYRYDAGHGSLVDDERVRQMRVELDFVRRHLP
ncbi:dipeptidyl aminopeptidase/acylaminoacyl peptidase [Kineococcus xinjiangensis]|uniref:Dipeptidyl aminopeptidase/acylaminoacyl peptidase n=1 Tax=Kineococcus xinjiangensis TaxID=512762 RepID=A0A2S6IF96_9ACTN|nr:prolyl oligopeptidase family serine peptidase [Kineococcus xinjiangensis]PPK92895.1 dipeptidyl aminopeptidase/acylaminoacyl peptidase [Kineococcus xinjiangensis]